MFPAVGAKEAVVANDALTAYDALTTVPLKYEAVVAVPNNEPVIPFDTINVFNEASEPDVITRLQFGI